MKMKTRETLMVLCALACALLLIIWGVGLYIGFKDVEPGVELEAWIRPFFVGVLFLASIPFMIFSWLI